MLRNLSELDFDLSRLLNVKCDSLILPHIWFSVDIYSNYTSISHHLALLATKNVFSSLLSLGHITKNCKRTKLNDPKMTLNVTRSKVHHASPFCSTIACFPDKTVLVNLFFILSAICRSSVLKFWLPRGSHVNENEKYSLKIQRFFFDN